MIMFWRTLAPKIVLSVAQKLRGVIAMKKSAILATVFAASCAANLFAQGDPIFDFFMEARARTQAPENAIVGIGVSYNSSLMLARNQAADRAWAEIYSAFKTIITRMVSEYILETKSEVGPEELARIVETVTITASQYHVNLICAGR